MSYSGSTERTEAAVVRTLLDEALSGLRLLGDAAVPIRRVELGIMHSLEAVYEALASTGDYTVFQERIGVALESARLALAALQEVDSPDEGVSQELARIARAVGALSGIVYATIDERADLPRRGQVKPPVRATLREPTLLNVDRPVLVPAIPLPELDDPPPPPPPEPELPPPVTTLAELEALVARDLERVAMMGAPADDEAEEKPKAKEPVAGVAVLPKIASEADAIREHFGVAIPPETTILDRAKSCLEDLAMFGLIRRPTPLEPWASGERFERRLLRRVDAIVACGAWVLPHLVKVLETRPEPDPEIHSGLVFLFGSIAGDDTFDQLLRLAAIAPLDDPNMLLAMGDALAFAPHPKIADEMRRWRDHPDPGRRVIAIRALSMRQILSTTEALGGTVDEDVRVAIAGAEALAHSVGDVSASMFAPLLTHADERVVAAALRSGILRRQRICLERAMELTMAGHGDHAGAAMIVGVVGGADALEVLRRGAVRADSPAGSRANCPTALRAMGWYGHPALVEPLIDVLYGDDDAMKGVAVNALQRLTNASITDDRPDATYADDARPFVRERAAPSPVPKLTLDPFAWTRWWRAYGHPTRSTTRYRFGHVWSTEDALWEIEHLDTTLDDRFYALADVIVRTGTQEPLLMHDYVARQERQMERLRKSVEARSPRDLRGSWTTRFEAAS